MSECGVFSYGEVGIDNIVQVDTLPTPEHAAFPTSDSYQIGGAAANFVVWLATWGVNIRLSGNAIGDDEYGSQLKAWLSRYSKLDLQYLEVKPGLRTPFCRILVTPDGERSILVYGYPRTPKTLLDKKMLADVRYLALDLYGGDERLEAARLAREIGAQTVLNDVIWLDHEILNKTDILINSAAFVRSEFPGIDVTKHAHELQHICHGIVVTTDGAKPILIIDQNQQEFIVQPPIVKPVDATGAGDAFRAGLVYGLLQNWGLLRSVQWAAAAGSMKVGLWGMTSNLPGIEEVDRLAARSFYEGQSFR
ncbi:MAG: carbohydrate kinase family protein [Anaerolineaceae bacterium]